MTSLINVKEKLGVLMRRFRLLLPLSVAILATACASEVSYVDPTGLTLNYTEYSLAKNSTLQLKATLSPKNAKPSEITWKVSSGTSYASVSDTGLVTSKSVAGTAKIKATLKSNSKIYATCTIKVVNEIIAVSGISFSESTAEVTERRSINLNPTISPSNATNTNVTWTTSNSTIATVNNGAVKGLKPGTAVITATTVDGGYSASINVTVNANTSNADAWTILVYLCGSTLESGYANSYNSSISFRNCGLATCDIKEILSVSNKPDDVNIVFETGGSKAWTTNANGNYSNGYDISTSFIQRHHVENGKIVLDAGQDRLTNSKMGLTSTLQSFIEYGLDYYPAEKTALILWNHGGGMQGVCFPDAGNGNCDEDGLEAKEVAEATKNALKNCGMEGQKLEWIGYDACLMSVQDIAEFNSPYYKYMVASQELEDGEGWDYDSWIDDLYDGKDTETVLKAIVDGFITANGGTSSRNNNQTLAYLNLAYASEYKTAWENMAKQLKNKITSSNKDDFNTLVSSVQNYGEDEADYYGLFDALDFVNKLSSSSFNPGSTYISAVTSAHSKLVGHSSCGAGAGNSNGVNMYWSVDSTCKSYNPYTANTDTHFSNWAYLSNTYYGESSGGWWW